jgi:phage replication-related protein YjqB (UPF0714/DUF867 family)
MKDVASLKITEEGLRRNQTYYRSFAELSRHEKEGIDYRILVRSGPSEIVVVAPHGGGIEPGTTEIAEAIAGNEHFYYSFEGLKVSGNGRLHLTSTRFDEPLGMEVMKQAGVVLALHGCEGERPVVFIGGLNPELRTRVREALEHAGFTVEEHAVMMGIDPMNLCNLGRSGGGVQLEISAGLRRQMFADLSRQERRTVTHVFQRFVDAVRQAVEDR